MSSIGTHSQAYTETRRALDQLAMWGFSNRWQYEREKMRRVNGDIMMPKNNILVQSEYPLSPLMDDAVALVEANLLLDTNPFWTLKDAEERMRFFPRAASVKINDLTVAKEGNRYGLFHIQRPLEEQMAGKQGV